MRLSIRLVMIATFLLGHSVFGQGTSASEVHTQSAPLLTGVWRGEMDGLPAFDLVLSDEGGTLQGAILFYLHKRVDANHPYTATPGLPEPIFDVHFDGTNLDFKVSHRRAHPPGSLKDPPFTMRLTPLSSDTARIRNQSEGPAVIIHRSEY
jgi:hypothetical protein